MRRTASTQLLLLSLLLSFPLAARASPLRAAGDYLVDPQGGVVLLRGVNVAGNSKVPPFTPIGSGALLDPLPGWGVNAIRLLFTWEAFEPARGAYQESYLAYYEQVVRWAAERGLLVLVDFHQDAYSRFSIGGCGEGFPAWAVTPEVPLATPDNGPGCADWGTRMIFDLAHHQTWSQFHADKYGARTAYLAMVERVAQRMSGHPNVIGYDLLNEPWGFDAELLALYEDVGARIRAHHRDALLFIPPHALASSGMAVGNLARPSFDNVVYAPHYYDALATTFKAWLGSDPAGPLDAMRAKAVSWQAPMVLDEFGADVGTWNVGALLEAYADWLDRRWVSGMQWDYAPGWTPALKDGWDGEDFSIVDGAGRLRANFVPRPYPQRTAGVPVQFVRSDGGFALSWDHRPAAGETAVYLPAGYADGRKLTVTWPRGVRGRCAIAAGALRCSADGPGLVQLTLAR